MLLIEATTTSLSVMGSWTELLSRHVAQVASSRCSGGQCSDGWAAITQALGAVGRDELVAEVNRLVNRLPYVADGPDVWFTPSEFLRNGGDCEDFVIAKYLLLRHFGVPADDLRLVVTAPPGGVPHAILVVKTSTGSVALDNLRRAPYALEPASASSIVYAFNERFMWLPTASLAGP